MLSFKHLHCFAKAHCLTVVTSVTVVCPWHVFSTPHFTAPWTKRDHEGDEGEDHWFYHGHNQMEHLDNPRHRERQVIKIRWVTSLQFCCRAKPKDSICLLYKWRDDAFWLCKAVCTYPANWRRWLSAVLMLVQHHRHEGGKAWYNITKSQ